MKPRVASGDRLRGETICGGVQRLADEVAPCYERCVWLRSAPRTDLGCCLFAAFVLGCPSPVEHILPEVTGSNVLLAVRSQEGEAWQLRVLGGDWRASHLLSTQAVLSIEFHGELGLPSDRWLGRQDLGRGSCALAGAPRRSRIWSPEAGGFRNVGAIPAELREVLAALAEPRCHTCVPWDVRQTLLPRADAPPASSVVVHGATFIGNARALVVTSLGMALLEPDGVARSVQGCDRGYVSVTLADASGSVFATDGEVLDRLLIDPDALRCAVLERVELSLTEGRGLIAHLTLAGDPTRSTPRVFGLIYHLVEPGGDEGWLSGFRFDSSGFRLLLDARAPNRTSSRQRAWLVHDRDLGPVFFDGLDRIYFGGETGPLSEVVVANRQLLGVSSVPGLGLLAFVEQFQWSSVSRWDDASQRFEGAWRGVEFAAFADYTRDAVPFRGGLVGFGVGGIVREWHLAGTCEAEDAGGVGRDRAPWLVLIDDDENIILTFRSPSPMETPGLFWVRPDNPRLPPPSVFP